MPTDRRNFLKLMNNGALSAAFPREYCRAMAIPASRPSLTSSLMQENRSFDHHFGTLRRVRDYGDPSPVLLPSDAVRGMIGPLI